MEPSVQEFGALFTRFLREVVERAPEQESALAARLRLHLVGDPLEAPLTTAQLAPFEHPDLQRALDAYVSTGGRSSEVIDSVGRHGMAFEDALIHARGPLGAPGYVERPIDVDVQLACLRSGVVLVSGADEPPHAFVVSSEDRGPFEALTVGVLSNDRGHGRSVLGTLRALMAEHSVYRGKVLTLNNPEGPFRGRNAGAGFLVRTHIERDAIVLPEGLLERIERRTIGFDAVAEQLAAQRLSRKRGVLLYGPPGTGKTLTAQYLIGRMTGRTVIVLTGQALGAIGAAASLARRLQPAALVLEDVDLIARDRSFSPGGNPVLFELLNVLDGLGEADPDVVVLLTTNRADLLEPALAARPGRVDLAVELPLPDASQRERLLSLYSAHVPNDVADWTVAVERTEGTPASFMREVVRSAALLAAERGAQTVTAGDVNGALDELLESGPVTAALLGVRWSADAPQQSPLSGPGPGPSMWSASTRTGIGGFFTRLGEQPDDDPYLTDEP